MKTCGRRLRARRAGPALESGLDPSVRRVYRDALAAARDAQIPTLIGGAYAFECLTGIAWNTKDLDLFVRKSAVQRLRDALEAAGFETEMKFPHWLAKARHGAAQIDIVFSSANGLLPVDDAWFEHAIPARLFRRSVQLCPVEESIAQRAFVMERERFDGADIIHFIRLHGPRLDWRRLLARFGPHRRVLLSHLLLFGFVYPGARDCVPEWLMRALLGRVQDELDRAAPPDRVCLGGMLSRAQYLTDFERWNYQDARLPPHGRVGPADVRRWTDAIAEEQPPDRPRRSGPMRTMRGAGSPRARAAGTKGSTKFTSRAGAIK
jgi:hypothetical protein